jgi:PAS domain-containing protein
VESYRNIEDRVCHKTILNVGFVPELKPEQLNIIQKKLTQLASGTGDLFIEEDSILDAYVTRFWDQILSNKTIDIVAKSKNTNSKTWVDLESIKHEEVREIGAEYIGYQTLNKLQLNTLLETLGWDEEKIQLTYTQIISRAVYPFSEHKTTRWIQENSAVCELSGYPLEKITKDKLYKNALDLYEIKDELEQHFSKKTNELFDIQDKIILFDLTNTYFEGRKDKSEIARFGRSKEKRSDAKLIVLAMVVNPEGFPKYTKILEGNTTDSASLPNMIDKLRLKTLDLSAKAIVVIDAGIATDENLKLIQEKGYDYVCVSRSKIKDYNIKDGEVLHRIKTQNKEEISLQRVHSSGQTDYILRVKSPGKKLKEDAMRTQFELRFEEEIEKIKSSLTKKNGVKKYDKVNQRIGRAIQKYPSVSKYYQITAVGNSGENATDLIYQKKEIQDKEAQENAGTYFIKTSLESRDEQTVWKIYNTIREIESTFRCLKTDIDLRPIYHKNDDASMAHLHLAILAYWLVNTVRHQLKNQKINCEWREIVRIANTQKVVYSTAKNKTDERIEVKKCSEPSDKLKEIYAVLKIKNQPFTKKSVVHKLEIKNYQCSINKGSPG